MRVAYRFVASLLMLFIIGCHSGTNLRIGVGELSPEAEALAGSRAAILLERSQGGVYTNPQAEVRMLDVGRILMPSIGTPSSTTWSFNLLDSSRLNAFSLPGNHIYLTRGLYERIGNDNELLAAVIAHEMAHIQNRDSFKPPGSCPSESLQREMTADTIALAYLDKAGISKERLVRVLELTCHAQPPDWARTRIEHLSLDR